MFSSCDSRLKNDQALLESISLSNTYYNESTRQFRDFFKTKALEQPKKYASDYQKMCEFEKKIADFHKIVGADQKKIFINALQQQFMKESGENNYKFVCLKVEDNEKIFDSLAKNDFNRILYKKYTVLYYRHYSVF